MKMSNSSPQPLYPPPCSSRSTQALALGLLDGYVVYPANQLVCYLIHVVFHLLHAFLKDSQSHPTTTHQQHPTQHHPTTTHHAILITTNDDDNSLPIHLALNFAAIGYHVFFQVSSQAQLAHVILRWQRLKSSLNKPLALHHFHPALMINPSIYHPSLFGFPSSALFRNPKRPPVGSLIPLLYLSNDLPNRLEAFSTINAYLRHNKILLRCLINFLNPLHIRLPLPSSIRSPSELPCRHLRSASSSSLSPPLVSRPLTGFSSPPPSDLSSHFHPPLRSPLPVSPSHSPPTAHHFYPSAPLPLAITTDNFLLDAFNDILIAPLATVQDLLPLLHSHNGRVINIWDSPRSNKAQSGLPALLRDALVRITDSLHAELEPLRIPVSTLFASPQSPRPIPSSTSSPPAAITSDVRSMLTEASDPDILEIFTAQSARENEHHGLGLPSDPARTFAMTRAVLETRFPGRSYPIGLRELGQEIARVGGPVGWVFGAFGDAREKC